MKTSKLQGLGVYADKVLLLKAKYEQTSLN